MRVVFRQRRMNKGVRIIDQLKISHQVYHENIPDAKNFFRKNNYLTYRIHSNKRPGAYKTFLKVRGALIREGRL